MCEYCSGNKDFNTDNEDFTIGIESNGKMEVYWQDPDEFHNLRNTTVQFEYCPMCGVKLGKLN